MPACAVAVCKTNSRRSKGTNITYHSFPKDSSLCYKWIRACKRKNAINIKHARICSVHFTVNDYVRDIRAELLGLAPRKILNENAVPNINLEGTPSSDTSASVCKHEFARNVNSSERIRMKKRTQETLSTLPSKNNQTDRGTGTNEKLIFHKELVKKVRQLEGINKRLKNKVNSLRREVHSLQYALREKNKDIQDIKCRTFFKKDITSALAPIFTDTQIKCILRRKKKVHWKVKDISEALTLRCVSKKCYAYLREHLHFPLPSLTTLKKWVSSSFTCNPGILEDVLQLMSIQAKYMKENEKLCILSFDEMNIDSRMCYDQAEDKIYGPHSNVQVLMARGLVSSWKQPIFYEYDTQMTGALLKKAIAAVQGAGFKVVGVVCDMGGKNHRVWKELSVNFTKSYFKNPTEDNCNVWVFPDIPHMLKLLRNHFVDHGFTVNSKYIGKEIIEKLLIFDGGELKICPKLTFHHITVRGRDRQKVSLACQLFSKHTAEAIRYTMPEEEEAASFFRLMNDVFDVLNSRVPKEDEPSIASAFGLLYEEQEDILKRFCAICEIMKVGNSSSLLPFQKGFLTSIKSLLGLFHDLKNKGVRYILTSRLNQDCLENLFSQIRAMGRTYDNPLPTDFKSRLRLLIIGKNIDSINFTRSCPVEVDCNERDYFTARLFSGLLPEMTDAMSMMEENEILGDATLPDELTDNVVPIPVVESECGAESLRYLAGYVAFRCRNTDRSLGHPSGDTLHISPRDSSSGWIERLSRGGLIVPSDEWLRKIKEFEVLFASIHGKYINKEQQVIKTLCHLLKEKFPEVDNSIIKIYARTRTFIRIKHLNVSVRAQRSKEYHEKKLLKWKSSYVSKKI